MIAIPPLRIGKHLARYPILQAGMFGFLALIWRRRWRMQAASVSSLPDGINHRTDRLNRTVS